MKRLAFAALLAIAAAWPAAADTLTFSLTQAYTGNLFQTRLSGGDAVTAAGLSWEKALGAFSVFASVDSALPWTNSGLADVDLTLGVDNVLSLGAKTALYFSLEGRAVRHRSDFADFDRTGGRFTASLKSYLSPSSILKATAATEYRSYAFAPFDFLSQGVSVSIDKYFASRTTLKAEAAWGYKRFLHPWLSDAATAATEAAAEAAAPLTAFPAPDDQGPPQDKGPGGSGSGSGGSDQRGSDNGPKSGGQTPGGQGPGGQGAGTSTWRGERVGYAYFTAGGGSSSIQMISANGTVAQGLGDRIGLRLTGIVQRTLSGENPYSAVDEFALIENPTYDAFAWQGWGWNAQATAVLPWNVEMRLGYTWTDKEFPGIESLDLDGIPIGAVRRDRRNQAELRVEKTFARWTAVLSCGYVRNESNDPLYSWKGPFVSLGLQWSPALGKAKR